MRYYLRYIIAEGPPPTLTDLRDGLRPLGPDYSFELQGQAGIFVYQGTPIAQLEISTPGDEVFEEERDELLDFLTAVVGDRRPHVEVLLRGATGTIAAQILAAGDDPAMVLQWLDPVWKLMFSRHRGLLQVDGEGYYDADGLVLKVD
jgi:hypothetical protein